MLAEEVDVTWLVVDGIAIVEDEGTCPLVVDIVPIGPIVCALVTPCPL